MQSSSVLKFRHLFLLITAALIAAVSFFRVHAYQDPSGGDGYFYLKQAEWLLNHGRFYHADYSFAFLPLAALTKIFGSSLTAYQFLTVINFSMILFSMGYFIQHNLPSEKRINALIAMAFMVGFSLQTPIQRMSFEFVKNGFAFGLLLISVVLIFRGRIKTAAAVAFFAAITHKTVALIIISAIFIYILKMKKQRNQILVLGLAIAVGIGLLNPRLVNHISSILSQFRTERLTSLMDINSHLIWSHLLLIIFWLGVFVSQASKINDSFEISPLKKGIITTFFIFSVIPILPFFAGPNAEIKWRMMIFSFCLSSILCFIAIKFIPDRKKIIAIFIFSALLLSVEFWNNSGFPWISNLSYQVPDVEKLNELVKPSEELITHHGMQFYVDYKTPIRAKSLLTAGAPPKYQLAYIPKFFLLDPDIADAVAQIKIADIGPSYGLFQYEDFQDLMKQYPLFKHWKNMFKIRPDFVQSY